MYLRNATVCILVITLGFMSTMPSSTYAAQGQEYALMKSLSNIPLSFTENQGQWDERVLFRADAHGAIMWFTNDGVYYQFTRAIPKEESTPDDPVSARPGQFDQKPDNVEYLLIRTLFIGANPSPLISGVDMLDYKCNYFLGDEPVKWRTNVPNYRAVTYKDIYPGIDLKYYGDGRQMEYDFMISPEADFSQIRVHYEGVNSLSVNEVGELVVETEWGKITELRPTVYQVKGDNRKPIGGSYTVLSENSFGFELGDDYDPHLPVLIDPILTYSTYLGGHNWDEAMGLAVDSSGHAYVTGDTWSGDFPLVNPLQDFKVAHNDVFITKLNYSGNELLFSTFLGGNLHEYGTGIALDGTGNLYIVGITCSENFPIVGAFQSVIAGGDDLFIAKVSNDGDQLLYCTYLGGSQHDYGTGIALDTANNVCVVGYTESPDFPLANPIQDTQVGHSDVLIAKLGIEENELQFSTYLGGSKSEEGWGIAVDMDGSIYLTGNTRSANDFPTENAFQDTYGGEGGQSGDAFVSKIDPYGSQLVYSTYLGGSDDERGMSIVVDNNRNAYVHGGTESSDFPTTASAYQSTYAGDGDAFTTKFSVSGNSLAYSTYLGGSDGEPMGISVMVPSGGIAVDASGCAYVTGETSSDDFPIIDPIQGTHDGKSDVYVAKFNSAGNSLVYSTFLGRHEDDIPQRIALDAGGNAYVCGHTLSIYFPTVNPYQAENPGGWSCFIFKLSPGHTNQPPVAVIDGIAPSPANSGELVYFSGHGTDIDGYIAAHTWISDLDGVLSSEPQFTTPLLSVGTHTIWFRVEDDAGALDSISQTLHVNQRPIAYIDSVTPNQIDEGGTVYFGGHGSDVDGSVVAYCWESSIDGELSTQASFSTSDLSSGTHTISLQVQDDYGGWSDKAFAKVAVIAGYNHETLLGIIDTLEEAILHRMEVMTRNVSLVEAYAFKGIHGTGAVDKIKKVLGVEGYIEFFLMWLLKGQPDPMSLGISITVDAIVSHMWETEVHQPWRNATQSIFEDMDHEPSDPILEIFFDILDILMTNPNGPWVENKIAIIESDFAGLRQHILTHDLPEPLPFNFLVYSLRKLAEDIQESNIDGEESLIRWYCPVGHIAPPEDNKVYLMRHMGDWTEGDINLCDYIKIMNSLRFEAENNRNVQGTAYRIKAVAAGVATILAKTAIAIITQGVSLVAEGFASAVFGVGLTAYGVQYDLAVMEAPKAIAEQNLQVMDAFSSDTDFLSNTIVNDVTAYVEMSMDPSNPPDYFPWAIAWLQDLEIPDIEIQQGEGMAEGVGSVTVKSYGPHTAKVNFFFDMMCISGPHAGKCLSVCGPTEIVELDSGQTATIPFEFSVPSPKILGHRDRYKARPHITIGTSPICIPFYPGYLLDSYFYVTISGDRSGLVKDQTVDSVMIDSVLQEQSKSTSYTTSSYQTSFLLDYGDGNLDLHVYDNMGNHTGYNYLTDTIETNIPNSDYTGSSEIISIEMSSGQEYTVEVRGVSTDGYERFYVSALETPERPPTLDLLPFNSLFIGVTGDSIEGAIPMAEIGGHHQVFGIELIPSDLVGDYYTVPSSNISFDLSTNIISAGANLMVQMQINVPTDAPAGEYSGDLQVNSLNGGNEQVTLTLYVDNPPATPLAPSGPVLAYDHFAYYYSTSSTDLEGDQVYFTFDWGDETSSEWLGPFDSGDTCTDAHSWADTGTYWIKAIARDSWWAESDWSDSASVTVFFAERGDANGDGEIGPGDIVFLINYLFRNGAAPDPLPAGDANCDGVVGSGDAVHLINYMFRAGPPPGCP